VVAPLLIVVLAVKKATALAHCLKILRPRQFRQTAAAETKVETHAWAARSAAAVLNMDIADVQVRTVE
jgi:hypothetical protein